MEVIVTTNYSVSRLVTSLGDLQPYTGVIISSLSTMDIPVRNMAILTAAHLS